MKYLSIILLLVSLSYGQMPAQGNQRTRAEQRIEAMKSAFITDRLRLSPQEAQQFWPLYNEFEDSKQQLRRQYQPRTPVSEMSEAEAEVLLEDMLEMERKLLDLKAQYIQRFKSILPARKIAMLPKIEEEFKKELLKRMQQARQRRRD